MYRKSEVRKALIIPLNSKQQIFIQDRRGHKKPDWGYFGGSIEGDEMPLETVIRETKEELSIDVGESDLVYLGESVTDWDGEQIVRYMYLYPTEQVEFDVKEGKGGYWFSFDEVRTLLDDKDRFDDIVSRIKESLK